MTYNIRRQVDPSIRLAARAKVEESDAPAGSPRGVNAVKVLHKF